MPACVAKIFANGSACKRSKILHSCRIGSIGSHHYSIFHSSVLLKRIYNTCHSRTFLTNCDINTIHRISSFEISTLIDNSIYRDAGFPCLPVANNEFALSPSNRNHGINRLDTCLQWCVYGFTFNNAVSHTLNLAEMTRFAVKLGANPMTFLGLAGVGDLIVTCSSPKSRNYQVGYALGEGLSLEDAVQRLGEVAEGVNTLKVLKARAEELDVYMPLVAGLHAILFEGRTLAQVIELLMLGEPKTDVDFIPTAGF